ncbi:MAG TPA: hypothetical protein EYG21_05745 [Nitrospinaceae bacterium]|jgi:hypothetical protein|nr:hypothetical protein [Nitrospinaceae bacterium]
MNILILNNNRKDTTSLAYHYCKLGHQVFYPMPFADDILDWSGHCLWPMLLSWSTEDPSITNFEYHDFSSLGKLPYGEDKFLFLEEWVDPIADHDVTVKFIDFRNDATPIHAYHITDAAADDGTRFFAFVDQYIPYAKKIDSGFNHFSVQRVHNSENICEYLPASFEGIGNKLQKNSVGFYRHSHEIKVLGIDPEDYDTSLRLSNLFVSFNHNFAVRHPEEYEFFEIFKNWFAKKGIEIYNYGGNKRGVGADIEFSGDQGLTGKFTTLSPRTAILKQLNSRATIHFKGTDWAGGVEAYSRFAYSPMIVLAPYTEGTNLNQFGREGSSVFTCYDLLDGCHYITRLLDETFYLKCIEENKKLESKIFSENYWNSWRNFLERIEVS